VRATLRHTTNRAESLAAALLGSLGLLHVACVLCATAGCFSIKCHGAAALQFSSVSDSCFARLTAAGARSGCPATHPTLATSSAACAATEVRGHGAGPAGKAQCISTTLYCALLAALAPSCVWAWVRVAPLPACPECVLMRTSGWRHTQPSVGILGAAGVGTTDDLVMCTECKLCGFCEG